MMIDARRTYLLALAVQLMAALVWRDCGAWDVLATVLIVPLVVVAWGVQEMIFRRLERR